MLLITDTHVFTMVLKFHVHTPVLWFEFGSKLVCPMLKTHEILVQRMNKQMIWFHPEAFNFFKQLRAGSRLGWETSVELKVFSPNNNVLINQTF